MAAIKRSELKNAADLYNESKKDAWKSSNSGFIHSLETRIIIASEAGLYETTVTFPPGLTKSDKKVEFIQQVILYLGQGVSMSERITATPVFVGEGESKQQRIKLSWS